MAVKTEQLLYNHLTFQKPSERSENFLMHCHNTYELIFFEKGKANYIIDDKKYKLHKNDLIFIRPYKYHYIEFTEDTEYSRMNIAFAENFIPKNLLHSIPNEIEVINCPPNSILSEIFGRMNFYADKLTKENFTEIMQALITEVLYNLILTDIDLAYIPSTLTPMLSSAIEYINENLFTIKEIREISAHLNISEQYLFRLFKSQLRVSPHKYLTIKRMLHAQNMIKQGKKPTAIYELCGFDSYVSFYRQYSNMFGHPPSQEDTSLKL